MTFVLGPELKYPADCVIVPGMWATVTPGTPTKEAGGTGVETRVDDIELVVRPILASRSIPELWTCCNNCCGGGTAV